MRLPVDDDEKVFPHFANVVLLGSRIVGGSGAERGSREVAKEASFFTPAVEVKLSAAAVDACVSEQDPDRAQHRRTDRAMSALGSVGILRSGRMLALLLSLTGYSDDKQRGTVMETEFTSNNNRHVCPLLFLPRPKVHSIAFEPYQFVACSPCTGIPRVLCLAKELGTVRCAQDVSDGPQCVWSQNDSSRRTTVHQNLFIIFCVPGRMAWPFSAPCRPTPRSRKVRPEEVGWAAA